MTPTFTKLSEAAFDAQYQLRTNHLNPHATWANGEDTGCLFETFGDELAFVRSQDPRTVWTLIDGEDGDLYLVSGYHFVNRLGCLITTAAVPTVTDIEVRIPMHAEPASGSNV